MRFSIVVPVYNKATEITFVLQALVEQSVPKEDFEVIVVDDGSTDDSLSNIRLFSDKLNLKILELGAEGRRASRSRNHGLEVSSGEIIVLLDGDVLPKLDFLRCHETFILSGYDISLGLVCGTGISTKLWKEKYSNHEIWKTGSNDELFEWLNNSPELADTRLSWIKADDEDSYPRLPAPYAGFWTGNVAFYKKLLGKVKGFDTNFIDRGNEDIEFGYRCWKNGAKVGLNRNVISFHIPHIKNHHNNYMSDTINSFEFIKKFPELEVELLGLLTCMQINEYLPEYLSWTIGNNQRATYTKRPILPDNKFINDKLPNLIVGACTFDASFIEDLHVNTLIDPNITCLENHLYSCLEKFHLSGVMTPLLNKEFQTGIITDYYRTVPNYLWEPLLREITRICDRTILIHNHDWHPKVGYDYRNNPGSNLYNPNQFSIKLLYSTEPYSVYEVRNDSHVGFQQIFINNIPEIVENEGSITLVNGSED